MTRIREPDLEPPLASRRGAREMSAYATGTAHRMADCVRAVAARTCDTSARDVPALGLADAVTALFTRTLRFDAADPHWPDRDRIVLPAGDGAEALLGAVLDLTGYAGLHAIHLHDHPAVQAVPGPPGQALGVAVGMALAERMLAARFGRSLVDHRTWVLVSPADLSGGISHEAASLAGHLVLDRLAVIWDDDGSAAATCSTDQLKRFAAAGWTTRRVDGRDPAELAAAMAMAARSRKPMLIACTTGANLPDGPVPPFSAPPELAELWASAGTRGAAARRGWKKRASRHTLRAEFDRVTAGRLPDGWMAALTGLRPALAAASTIEAGRQVTDTLAQAVPELVGGAPGGVAGLAAIAAGRFGGQSVPHGARLHGMAACTAGLALHGGVVPFTEADLTHGDTLRPSLRLLAAARQRAVHVLADDGTEPDQLFSLSTVPGLHLHRPADMAETAECWELSLRRTDGPSVLILSRRESPSLRMDTAENRCARGGYILAEADGPRQATLIASGTEVAAAMAARAELATGGVAVTVVSLPCWELFGQMDAAEAAQVLGHVLRVGIAQGAARGWDRWLGPEGLLLAGAPATITAAAIASAVRKRLSIEEEKAA